jgi:predicted Zn-dependent protease
VPTEPSGATQTAASRTEQSIATAQELESQGKTKQAMDVYENAIAQTPANSALLSRLAFMYLNQGRPTDAIAYAQRAIQADQSNSEGWIVLGAARYELGDRKAAKEAYRSCAELGRGAYVVECKRMLR